MSAGECGLVSRNDNAFKRFGELHDAVLHDLHGIVEAVLDGEVVVLDRDGRSQFNQPMFAVGRQCLPHSICYG